MSDTLEFIHYIVEHIVDHPEDIEIKVKEGDQVEIYELSVNESDIGKVIGKHGYHAGAIRTLVGAVSSKAGKKAILEISE